MFSEKTIAQMAAFFIAKEQGNMPVLKLMKLLYLADRESLDRHGHPISYDRMGSMDQGPVLSRTLDYINGSIESEPEGWESWVTARAGHEVGVAKQPDRDALTELSDADLQILENTWARFGHMTKWQIRDYTHQNLPEWRNPSGGYLPIFYKDVFAALGKEDQVEALTESLRTLSKENSVFDRL